MRNASITGRKRASSPPYTAELRAQTELQILAGLAHLVPILDALLQGIGGNVKLLGQFIKRISAIGIGEVGVYVLGDRARAV